MVIRQKGLNETLTIKVEQKRNRKLSAAIPCWNPASFFVYSTGN